MTHKIVSNKVFPRQLSNQKNTRTYTMMMQLKVVAVWVFLLVSIAGLTEGKWGPFIVTQYTVAYVLMHESVMGIDTSIV